MTQSGNHICCDRCSFLPLFPPPVSLLSFRSFVRSCSNKFKVLLHSTPFAGFDRSKRKKNQFSVKNHLKAFLSDPVLKSNRCSLRNVVKMCSPSPKRRHSVDVKSPIAVVQIPKASQCDESPSSSSPSSTSSSCWRQLTSRSRSAARRLVRKYRHRRNCNVS